MLTSILALASLAVPVAAAPFVPKRDAHCVAMSPDGKLVAVGISGQSNGEFPPRPAPSPRKSGVIGIYEVASQKRMRRIETFGDVTRVAFSPDGKLLAAARLFALDDSLEMNEVRVWEVATGQVKFVYDRCHAFAFAPRGNRIAVASRRRCVEYDLVSGGKLRQFPLLADALNLAWSSDGESLLGIVSTERGFAVRSCDRNSGRTQAESLPLAEPFYTLAIPTAGSGLATGHGSGQVVVWNQATLTPVMRLQTGGRGRAFPFYSPDGSLLGAADQDNADVVIWHLDSRQEQGRYTFQQGTLHSYGSKSERRRIRPEDDPGRFVFSPDGEGFLGGPYGGILRLVEGGRDIARFGE